MVRPERAASARSRCASAAAVSRPSARSPARDRNRSAGASSSRSSVGLPRRACEVQRGGVVVGKNVGQVFDPAAVPWTRSTGQQQRVAQRATLCGSCEYATSRARTCQKAYSASPAIELCRAGRTSSLRTSSRSVSVTSATSRSPIAATAPAQKTLPDDRGVGEQRLALGRQGVEAGGDQRADRAGQRDLGVLRAAASRPPSARGGPGPGAAGRTPRRTAGCPRRARGSVAASSAGSTVVSRSVATRRAVSSVESGTEVDVVRVAKPRRIVRMALVQLGSRGADDEERHAFGPVGEVLEEGEHRVVGPVEVLEHEDGRTVRRRGAPGTDATR